MAAKSTTSNVYFNNQAFIMPHTAVNKLPESFKGVVINQDEYLIGIPNGLRYSGYIDINNIVKTPVYICEHVQLYSIDVAQNGIGWVGYETAVIADGHLLMYVNISLCKPDIWYRVGSGVKHVFNNVGKRVTTASIDLTDYLVINNYVIKPTHTESLATDDVGDYTLIDQCAVLPEWTLSEIELARLDNYKEFISNNGDYWLMFPDGDRQYLLVHHNSIVDTGDTMELRFWTDLAQYEVVSKLKEKFPTLHYMIVSVGRDRSRGTSFVMGIKSSNRVYDQVARFINTLDN